MLTIRETQIHVFRQQAADAELLRIEAFVRQMAPAEVQGLAREELRKRVEAGVRRASGRGLHDLRSQGLFVLAMFLAGPRFDEHPACAAILGEEQLPPEARVIALFQVPPVVDWAAVKAWGAGNVRP
jgi:hypothetical protein